MSVSEKKLLLYSKHLPQEWRAIDILVNNAGPAVGLIILIAEILMTGTE